MQESVTSDYNRTNSALLNAANSMASAEASGVITAAAAVERYELMIHSLIHEHTRDNLDRHALLLEKWCRDYAAGFYLRDIPYIIKVLNILLDRLDINYGKFRHILAEFLKIMSKPLFESKANERFRPGAKQSIANLYSMIVTFWQLSGDLKLGLDICKCFRCIVNSGVDPTILKVDIIKWENDGNKMQITEKSLILNILRGGGILDSVVSKFVIVLDEFLAEQQQRDNALAKEDLKKKQNAAGDDTPQLDSSQPNSAANPSSPTSAPVQSDDENKLQKLTEYVQSMLDLCMEITQDDVKCAAHMCHVGIFDTLITLLKDAAKSGPRHRRIPQVTDLMWIVLEAYVTVCKTGKETVPVNDLEEGGLDDTSCESPTSLRPNYITYSLNSKIMNFEKSVEALCDVLLLLVLDGYRLVDKECRNEIVIVLALILEFKRSFPCYVNSDVLTVIITYACAGEMGKNSWAFFSLPLAKFRNFVSSFDIDMQFKRELWMLTSDLMANDDPDVLSCVASSPLLSAMFLYLEQNSIEKVAISSQTSVLNNENSLLQGSSSLMKGPELSLSIDSVDSAMNHLLPKQSSHHTTSLHNLNDDKNTTAYYHNNKGGVVDLLHDDKNKEEPNIAFLNTLSKSQLKEFQTLAMRFLAQNATKIIGEFVRIKGPRRLLSIISHYCQSSDPIHKEIAHFGLILINKCLLCSNIVRKIMEVDNAIHIFLYLFTNSAEESTRAQAVRLISVICRGGNLICQNQVRNQNGIRQCIDLLANFSNLKKPLVGTKAGVKFLINPNNEPEDPTADTSGDASVIIVATLDCIREAVIGNKKAEIKFAKLEGIDAILNLLEVSSFLLRVQVLRLISDLLDNSKLNSFLHAWRSAKTMRSSAQLFAHCWLDEEARLESRRTNGVVNNLWDPLGHQNWPVSSTEQHSQYSVSSGSFVDNKSIAVSKLASAILAARTSVGSVVPSGMKASVMEKDTRGIIASILEKIGLFQDDEISAESKVQTRQQELTQNSLKHDSFDDGYDGMEGKSTNDNGSRVMLSTSATGDLMMDASDKQVVAIAKRYNLLKEGEWWSSIMEDFQVDSMVPIEADMTMIDIRFDSIFNATMAVQLEQMRLDDHALFEKKKQEHDYNEQIIVQKNLQIKAEWLKRNGKNKMK